MRGRGGAVRGEPQTASLYREGVLGGGRGYAGALMTTNQMGAGERCFSR
jgi:hypothetical protein